MRIVPAGFAGLFLLGLTAQPGRADDAAPPVDKSGYTLFNPTPPDAMRAFEPERPAKILNPFTVDAGHFQIESDFLNYIHANDAGLDTQFFETADPTIKLGLTNSIDFEIVFNAYQNAITRNDRTGEIVASARGFGDTMLKAKFNLVGNDGGPFAMAVVPYVKLPSAAPGLGNNVVEGGVALPAQINLPADFALALQTEVNSLKDANDARHYANFVNIANLSHAVALHQQGPDRLDRILFLCGNRRIYARGLHVRRGSGLSGPGECPARRGRQFRPHQIVAGSQSLYRDHRPFLNRIAIG